MSFFFLRERIPRLISLTFSSLNTVFPGKSIVLITNGPGVRVQNEGKHFLGVIYFWGLGGCECPGGLIFIVVSVSFNSIQRPHLHFIHKNK